MRTGALRLIWSNPEYCDHTSNHQHKQNKHNPTPTQPQPNPSPAQPSPTQPNPAQPSPAQPSPASQPDTACPTQHITSQHNTQKMKQTKTIGQLSVLYSVPFGIVPSQVTFTIPLASKSASLPSRIPCFSLQHEIINRCQPELKLCIDSNIWQG
jgi:hypothetical protein